MDRVAAVAVAVWLHRLNSEPFAIWVKVCASVPWKSPRQQIHKLDLPLKA